MNRKRFMPYKITSFEKWLNIGLGVLLLVLFIVSHSVIAQSDNIELFVNAPIAVNVPGVTIHVYDLSEVDRIRERGPTFSPDVTIAQKQANIFLQSEQGQRYVAAMKEGYSAHRKLMQYGLRKLPAVVFEQGRYVVYGTSDVVQAMRDYHYFIQRASDIQVRD